MGDFNAVCRGDERSGINNVDGVATSTEIIEFRSFLEELELVDLPLLGRQFTWYQASGRAMIELIEFSSRMNGLPNGVAALFGCFLQISRVIVPLSSSTMI
jgi:hypothetical protein